MTEWSVCTVLVTPTHHVPWSPSIHTTAGPCYHNIQIMHLQPNNSPSIITQLTLYLNTIIRSTTLGLWVDSNIMNLVIVTIMGLFDVGKCLFKYLYLSLLCTKVMREKSLLDNVNSLYPTCAYFLKLLQFQSTIQQMLLNVACE